MKSYLSVFEDTKIILFLLNPLLVPHDVVQDPVGIAIGKGAERIFLLPVEKDADLAYFRKDGVHYVPKHKVEDLLI